MLEKVWSKRNTSILWVGTLIVASTMENSRVAPYEVKIELQLQLFSHYVVRLVLTTWTTAHQASLSFTISQSLLKFLSIESVVYIASMMLFVAPFSFCLQSFPASGYFPMSWLFASGAGKYCSFSISPSTYIQG